MTDQAGDLEQPNVCVTTDQPSLELNTLIQNVYEPNSLPTHNFVPIPEEQADTQLMIEATHTIQPPITPNQATLCQELEQPYCMNVMDKLSSSLYSLVPYGFDCYRVDQSTKFGTVIP